MSKRLTKNDFILKAKEKHGDKYDYSLVVYKNNKDKVEIICPIHGVFNQRPKDHMRGDGCPKHKNQGDKLSHNNDIFIEKAKIIHGDKFEYDLVDYKNNYTKVKIKCRLHGIWEQKPSHHLYGKGCPSCNTSKGELKIQNILKNKNIKYLTQYSFVDCKYKKPLKFDLYLPDYNTCIEYDGQQHFQPILKFGGDKKLELNQLRDKIKENYCIENNINLIRVKYCDNIEELFSRIPTRFKN